MSFQKIYESATRTPSKSMGWANPHMHVVAEYDCLTSSAKEKARYAARDRAAKAYQKHGIVEAAAVLRRGYAMPIELSATILRDLAGLLGSCRSVFEQRDALWQGYYECTHIYIGQYIIEDGLLKRVAPGKYIIQYGILREWRTRIADWISSVDEVVPNADGTRIAECRFAIADQEYNITDQELNKFLQSLMPPHDGIEFQDRILWETSQAARLLLLRKAPHIDELPRDLLTDKPDPYLVREYVSRRVDIDGEEELPQPGRINSSKTRKKTE